VNDSAVVLDDDDDDLIRAVIQIDNVEVNEADEAITFTISKAERTPLEVPVNITTVGIEATPDVDYVDQTLTVILSRRKNVEEQVTFKLIDDLIDEDTETFKVQLAAPIWVRVDENGGIGSIVDDDTAGIDVDGGDGVSVVEGGTTDSISMVLLTEPQSAVAIDVAVDGDQLEANPASLTFDAENWAQPQTVTLAAVADGIDEEDFHSSVIELNVSSNDAHYDDITLEDLEAVIEDEDALAISITGPDVGAPGQQATFTASLNTAGSGKLSYEWEAFLDGNAVEAGDEATFSFTPSASGNYFIRAVITDDNGQAPAAFTDYRVLGDIAASPFTADIVWLAAAGITKGCNPPANDMFCPNETLTRGQMAAFLVRFFGLTDPGDGDAFIDDDGSIFENEIDILAAAGITAGCNPPESTHYCPDKLIDRGHMAAFLARALALTDNGGGDLFVDDDAWIFENDIDELATAGITKGCNPPDNDRYCPGDYVTRGQMAAFLHRAEGLLTE